MSGRIFLFGFVFDLPVVIHRGVLVLHLLSPDGMIMYNVVFIPPRF